MKNIVYTISFEILSPQYSWDWNHIYFLTPMGYCYQITSQPYNKHFKVSPIDNAYATDNKICYIYGVPMPEIDLETFQILPQAS